jgi:hypothetical protein
MKFEWEKIYNAHNTEGGTNTYRARVIGGWIITTNTYTNILNDGNERSISESIVFIPDAKHEWEIDKE